MSVRVYVAGPITLGDYMLNVRNAVNAADELRSRGFFPYVPHSSALWHFAHPREYEDWMEQCLAWLEVCTAVLRIPGASSGADREVAHAALREIPVFYSVDEVSTHFGKWR